MLGRPPCAQMTDNLSNRKSDLRWAKGLRLSNEAVPSEAGAGAQ